MEAYNILDRIPDEGDYVLARLTGVGSLAGNCLFHVMYVDGQDAAASFLRAWADHGTIVEWKPLTFAQYRTPIFNKTAYAGLWDSI